MTDLSKAVERLTLLRDHARNGTPVTDPNEWEADELDFILHTVSAALSAPPSERWVSNGGDGEYPDLVMVPAEDLARRAIPSRDRTQGADDWQARALAAEARVNVLEEALGEARNAVASLGEHDLGVVTDDNGLIQHSIRDELLAMIDIALAALQPKEVE